MAGSITVGEVTIGEESEGEGGRFGTACGPAGEHRLDGVASGRPVGQQGRRQRADEDRAQPQIIGVQVAGLLDVVIVLGGLCPGPVGVGVVLVRSGVVAVGVGWSEWGASRPSPPVGRSAGV